MAEPVQPYDLITMGRIGVDLYPLQTGVPLAQVESFGKFLGGSADQRRGRRRPARPRHRGDHPHRRRPLRHLSATRRCREFGVDDRWVTPVAGLPDPGHLLRDLPAGRLPAVLLPAAQGPRPGDPRRRAGPRRHPRRPRLLDHRHRPERGAQPHGHPRRPRGHAPGRGTTVFDLDWRPDVLERTGRTDPARPARTTREALRHATVAVGNLDECEVATGVREPRACAEALLAAGVELAVVKQGPKGVLAVHRDGTSAEVPPVPVEVVNGLGAGDAFGGSLCHGLLAGWDLERIMRYANAAGAHRRLPPRLLLRDAHAARSRSPRGRALERAGPPTGAGARRRP